MKTYLSKLLKYYDAIYTVDFHTYAIEKFNSMQRSYEHMMHSEEISYASAKEIDAYIEQCDQDLDKLLEIIKDFHFWTLFNFCQFLFLTSIIICLAVFIAKNYLPDSILSGIVLYIFCFMSPFYSVGASNYETNEYFKKKLNAF